MKVVLLCLVVIALASAGVVEKRQICANNCNQNTLSGCHHNQVCVQHGCNHFCEFIIKKRQDCPPVLCKMYCAQGFAKGSDGCPICACA
ncbi:antistasin isoform X1 [Biomphalaria pfeifferi]|uniref:Antistasin isoform X1 n=1 Tax=Biomphalaria pfeifferi TaxID=112525 RepID=A0AAD8F3H3_BIOPF|nr:antistasin isoform X1 [Biomphalaria pfeifferi]